MAVAEYQKLKCIFCHYEFVSLAHAKRPRCAHCGSRRLERITEFSVLKPYRVSREGSDYLAKKPSAPTEEYSAPREPAPKKRKYESDIDNDILGDD